MLGVVLLAAYSARAQDAEDREALPALVDDEGAVWVQADAYAEQVGGSVKVEGDGQLLVLCIGDLCMPFPTDTDVVRIKGKPYLRASRLSSMGGDAAAPAGLRPGQAAPGFALKALDGALVSLADYRGKKLLVFAWASW